MTDQMTLTCMDFVHEEVMNYYDVVISKSSGAALQHCNCAVIYNCN